jgi:hypothetical protein
MGALVVGVGLLHTYCLRPTDDLHPYVTNGRIDCCLLVHPQTEHPFFLYLLNNLLNACADVIVEETAHGRPIYNCLAG